MLDEDVCIERVVEDVLGEDYERLVRKSYRACGRTQRGWPHAPGQGRYSLLRSCDLGSFAIRFAFGTQDSIPSVPPLFQLVKKAHEVSGQLTRSRPRF
jgi:hypothetical protein